MYSLLRNLPVTRSFVFPIVFFLLIPPRPRSTLFPYTTLFRSVGVAPTSRAPASRHDTSCPVVAMTVVRSEEHTSELQSLRQLVCRLLLEKKKPSGFVDEHKCVARALTKARKSFT